MSVAEMKIYWWMNEVTREDKIRKKYYTNVVCNTTVLCVFECSIGVAVDSEEDEMNKLRWFGHELWTDDCVW